jgi:hypothetical protein
VQPYVDTLPELGEAAARALAAYTTADNSASAQNLARSGVSLGQRLGLGGGGRWLSDQLVGISIEEMFLRQLPPDETVDWLGQSPVVRLGQLQRQRELIETLSAMRQSALPRLNDAEFAQYVDQVIQSGELEAVKWLASRAPAQQRTSSPN